MAVSDLHEGLPGLHHSGQVIQQLLVAGRHRRMQRVGGLRGEHMNMLGATIIMRTTIG